MAGWKALKDEKLRREATARTQWNVEGFQLYFKHLYETSPPKEVMQKQVTESLETHAKALQNTFEGKADLGFYAEDTMFKDWRKDIIEITIFVFGMLIFVRAVQALVFPLIARLLRVPKEKRVKAAEAMRELSFYMLSLYLWSEGTSVIQWMQDLDSMWKDNRQTKVEPEFKALYFFEASWYMAGIVSLLIDAKRKDFFEMLFHHIFTTCLLLISYHEGHLRVGAVVVFLHNLADPLLQGAKLFNYLKMETFSTIFFAVFTVIFIGTRIVYFPSVIYSCQFRGPSYFFDREHNSMEKTLVGLLTALVPIHIYWVFLIFRVLQKALFGGGVSDARSDSDDEDAPPVETKKGK